MLTKDSVTGHLRDLIASLENQQWDQATNVLAVLDFHRLLKPLVAPAKSGLEFIDPANMFGGAELVHETGDHLRNCEAAIEQQDQSLALREAEAAMERWTQDH